MRGTRVYIGAMRTIPRSFRRLFFLIAALPVLLFALALIYQAGMLQEIFVIFAEFAGVLLIFLVVPVFLIPFLEERFEARLPTALPDLTGHVFIYRYGRAVTSLVDELVQAGIPHLIFEEDEPTARRLFERDHPVVLGNLQDEDPDLSNLVGARGFVLNGSDEDNAAMILGARYHGYTGPIVALVENPQRRPPILRAGATSAFTPDHVLAAAIAARASGKISPRLSGVRHLGRHLEVAELRVQATSPLSGVTLAEAGIRAKTGATVVGLWAGGSLIRQPDMATTRSAGSASLRRRCAARGTSSCWVTITWAARSPSSCATPTRR